MTKVVDSATSAALTAAQNDSNLSSLAGINEAVSGTTYTVIIDDQNRTLEFTNSGTKIVTLTLLSTITSALHTDDFRVILINLGAGTATINTNVSDTFHDTTTSQTLIQYEFIELQSSATGTVWSILRKGIVTIPATANNLAMIGAGGEVIDSLVESDGSGNITANVTGNLTGDVTGDVTGDLTGNADTATTATTATTANDVATDAVSFDDEIKPGTTSGTWAVTSSGFLIPRGIYAFYHADGGNSISIEFLINSGWRAVETGINLNIARVLASDGVKVRIKSAAGTVTTQYDELFD